MLATKLSNALVAPSKVANILDWRKAFGAVMGLDITRDMIGLAVVEHPDHICESVPLISIPLHYTGAKKAGISKSTLSELESIIRHHHVCASIVNWPAHNGRMGEDCGKVLHVLDSVINRSNSIISPKRPFTLWGSSSNVSFASFPPDNWGRSVEFSRAPAYTPGMSFSSKSVLRQEPSYNPSLVAASVLEEWVEKHWQIDSNLGIATAPKLTPTNFFFDPSSIDEFNSETASLQAALL
mmetsp:Transcript_11772/g.18064  ORF Transcript_11772/g.18064 Transcript_11772/m.18064 type:complete len:239 (-) Transcript_11772:105-821(-)